MRSHAVLSCLLSLAVQSCVIETTNRSVGTPTADGSIYLGWDPISRESGDADGRHTFDIGAKVGPFSSFRVRTERRVFLTRVEVTFVGGERFDAVPPKTLASEEFSPRIALPGAPRRIERIVVVGRTERETGRLEIFGDR
jgi:hypothetical protein